MPLAIRDSSDSAGNQKQHRPATTHTSTSHISIHPNNQTFKHLLMLGPGATEDKQHSTVTEHIAQSGREILSTAQIIIVTRVLKVRGAMGMHTGTLNYLGSQERLLWGSGIWDTEAWREVRSYGRGRRKEGKFRQKPWLSKCKFTLVTDGDVQAEVNCHAGNTWIFTQEGYGAAHRLWKKAWPPIQRGPYNCFLSPKPWWPNSTTTTKKNS